MGQLGANKVKFLDDSGAAELNPSHRKTDSQVLRDACAYHEAGHSIAILWAFRRATWLPNPAPRLPISHVEIIDHGSGRLSGNCYASNVYSTTWSQARLAEPYIPLMEAQIVVELGGGIAEALHQGEQRLDRVLNYAVCNCCMDIDLQQARAVLHDFVHLTKRPYELQPFAERALTLLLANWDRVEALATALIAYGHLEGDQIERIIDCANTS